MSDINRVEITVGAILLVMGLLKMNNNKKPNRGFQYPFLIISPVLAVAEAVALVLLRGELWQWLNRFPWASGIISALTQAGGSFFGAEILVLNVLIALVYFIVKLILRPILTAFMKHGRRMQVADAYTWDEDYQSWYLKEDRTALRSILRGTIWITALLTGAVCAAAWIGGPDSDFWFMAFPSAALIVLMEYYIYYNGMTRDEYLTSIGGDGIRTSAHRQFNKLREVYETLFPESLLSSRTGKDFQSRSGAYQLLKDLSESPDRTDRLVGEYYLHLRNRKPGSFDVDMVNATCKLLHQESAIIFNPFYRDVSDYMTLPVVDTLLNGNKCLVIVGRQSMKENVAQWMTDILSDYCRTDRLWEVSSLGRNPESCDVGILAFSDLYDLDTINDSEEFLLKVGFVVLVEPSRMLTTSQAGLSIVVGKFNPAKQPNFCALDHESDGLVDLLSHIFQQNVTNVFAAPPIRPTYTAMGWNASGDYKRQSLFQQQTHFLGNGTELASVALKYQVDHVDWFSEEKAPVADIHWIAEQYYSQISRYAGLPYEQKSIEDRIHFSSDLWEKPVTDHSFIIAEDETCNLFATLRAYLSRGTKQSFVHVFSENYLLRDYMRYNWQMFMSDAKAIPMLSPHYAKTERNTVMRLVLLMASEPMSQKLIEQELQLLGYDGDECYRTLSDLITRYTGVRETIITVKNKVEDTETLPVSIQLYTIPKRTFDLHFADTLKNAFFVVEDEELGTRYIDARMFGHIKQLVMPGQQVIYGGKLYKVHSISPQAGCILHRASDEYMSRLYYRQNRTYTLEARESDEDVVSRRKAGDIEIAVETRSFSVCSTGYLEMKDLNDIRTARYIDLKEDPCIGSYNRVYKHKAVMSLRLPGTDAAVRYTLCLLLSELMHTLFPYSWPYLAVLCKKPDPAGSKTNQLLYDAAGEVDDELIYILEDSDMDLGLLEAIDNNLFRILEIVTDYLNWYEEKYHETPSRDPTGIHVEIPIPPKEKRRGLGGLLDRIFGKRKKKKKDQKPEKGKEKEKEKPPAADRKTDGSGDPSPEAPAAAPADSAAEAPAGVPADTVAEVSEKPKKKRRGLLGLLDRIFGNWKQKRKQRKEKKKERKKKKGGKEKDPENNPPENARPEGTAAEGAAPEEAPAAETEAPAEPAPEEPENTVTPEPETPAESPEESGESNRSETMFASSRSRKKGRSDPGNDAAPLIFTQQSKNTFLRFGYDEIDPALAIAQTRDMLNGRGFGANNLIAARKGADANAVRLEMDAECYCDFCGRPLSGVSYDRLADGRIRCQSCASSAINDVAEFTDVFFATLTLMEDNYHISYHIPISIRVADAKTIASLSGRVFVPTSGYDGRIVGFAQHKGQNYTLYVENGSPRLSTIATTAHEMTHIWQYVNWNRRKMKSLYAQKSLDIVYEGMASWAEIQTLYMIGEYAYAQEQEQILAYRAENRNDSYGVGFLLYREKYGIGRQGDVPEKNPFNTFPPL